MILTQAYLRKLIAEELLNEKSSKSELAQKASKQTEETSPFIKTLNKAQTAKEQFEVLKAFLNNPNVKIKDKEEFYTKLYNMAKNELGGEK